MLCMKNISVFYSVFIINSLPEITVMILSIAPAFACAFISNPGG